MKKLIVFAILLALIPSAVSADELWIRNQGGLEIVIDGTVTDVQYDGLYVWNPNYSEGQAKVAAVDLKDGWVVITGDFTGYTIEVACNQKAEDVNPEVMQVVDINGTRVSFDPRYDTRENVIAVAELYGLPPAPPSDFTPSEPVTHDYASANQGSSDALVPTYDFPDPYWLWT